MSCQSCNTCQGCNSCEGCDRCQVVCDTKQAFCSIGSQLVSKYVDIQVWDDKDTGSLFLTAQEWNDFITSIYEGYCKGDKSNGWGDSTDPSINEFSIYNSSIDIRAGQSTGKTPGTEDFMYADMYNGAIKKMRYLAYNDTNTNEYDVSKNDVIYATAFNKLKKYATDHFLLHGNQCDNCNIQCDGGCNSCQGCNTNQCNTSTSCCDDTPSAGGGGTT